MSCGVGLRCGSDPEMQWLWRNLAATALIRPIGWEPPNAMGVALEKAKRPKKKKNLYGTTKDPELLKQSSETKTKQEASLSQTSSNITKSQSSRQCGTGATTNIQTNGTE